MLEQGLGQTDVLYTTEVCEGQGAGSKLDCVTRVTLFSNTSLILSKLSAEFRKSENVI